LESNKSCHFAGFAGVLRGVLVGKNAFQWLLWYLRIIALSKPFRMPQSSSVLCGANLDLPNAFLFSKQLLMVQIDRRLTAVPEWQAKKL